MTRAFNILFGMRALERFAVEYVVAWAEACLADGRDSVSLRICAGLDARTSSSEADIFLQHALKELNVALPTRADTLKRYVEQVAMDVLENRCSPAFAVHEICAVETTAEAPPGLDYWRWLDDARFDLESGYESYVFRDLSEESFATEVRDAARKLLGML